ncbi:DMT family transporter [Acidaminobacter hydrogenoformans]|uniref:Threonine/homoserine efflux transporter RhtA n=1 Tax=Acidaminobacter hydrogenoformans DSM 2784 TaxID=1120920 RepID=A0A1G5S1F3_9FIRM|nr:DMT family transporter [Acidaminobacter hydrogenoformans]SCZ80194.1 Threonine/homoserine efflux transporter RhtA [Acidaminobacter hydrogenoformans DSM 2784]
MNNPYFKYVLSLLLFGSNGIVASMILLGSHEIVFWRTLVGSLLLLIFFRVGGGKFTALRHKKHLAYAMISGAALGVSWIFLFEAYSRIGVSVATLAYYCGPVLVIAISPLLFEERLTPAKLTGLSAVILGMVFVNGLGLLTNGLSWGLFCGLSSAVMYAAMIVFNKKSTQVKGLENALYQLLMSFVTVAVYTFLRQGGPSLAVTDYIFPILIFGLINTAIGCYLYFASIDQLSTGSVSIIGYLEPLSALVFSAVFLHEQLTVLQVIGAVMILSGAAFSELYREKPRTPVGQAA